MYSARSLVQVLLFVISFGLAGCDGITDDLFPSGDDKRQDVVDGSMGTQVSQQSPDFSILDTLGNSRGLYDELSKPGAVASAWRRSRIFQPSINVKLR
mgnify:CR=1 FL=1